MRTLREEVPRDRATGPMGSSNGGRCPAPLHGTQQPCGRRDRPPGARLDPARPRRASLARSSPTGSKTTQKIKFSMLAEARRVSLSNTSLSTSMKKPLQVSVGCQTAHSTEATASDLGGSERRQLLARIADLETALAAANARAFFGAEPQTSSRPDTVGPQSDAQSLLGADSWEPAQSVFGAVPQHHPHQLSDGPSTRGSTPSLRPISRGFTPDAGHLDRAPPRSPNNSPSSLYSNHARQAIRPRVCSRE